MKKVDVYFKQILNYTERLREGEGCPFRHAQEVGDDPVLNEAIERWLDGESTPITLEIPEMNYETIKRASDGNIQAVDRMRAMSEGDLKRLAELAVAGTETITENDFEQWVFSKVAYKDTLTEAAAHLAAKIWAGQETIEDEYLAQLLKDFLQGRTSFPHYVPRAT